MRALLRLSKYGLEPVTVEQTDHYKSCANSRRSGGVREGVLRNNRFGANPSAFEARICQDPRMAQDESYHSVAALTCKVWLNRRVGRPRSYRFAFPSARRFSEFDRSITIIVVETARKSLSWKGSPCSPATTKPAAARLHAVIIRGGREDGGSFPNRYGDCFPNSQRGFFRAESFSPLRDTRTRSIPNVFRRSPGTRLTTSRIHGEGSCGFSRSVARNRHLHLDEPESALSPSRRWNF